MNDDIVDTNFHPSENCIISSGPHFSSAVLTMLYSLTGICSTILSQSGGTLAAKNGRTNSATVHAFLNDLHINSVQSCSR